MVASIFPSDIRAGIVRVTIDLRRLPRDGLDRRLHDLELIARQQMGGDVEFTCVRTPDHKGISVEFHLKDASPAPAVLTDRPLDTNTLQGLGQFDRSLAKSIVHINGSSDMPVTGASLLGEKFRSQLEAVKKKVNDAGDRMDGALKSLNETADQAVSMAKQVETETADLQAALGLHSNGAPE